jgi:hypothetical protein
MNALVEQPVHDPHRHPKLGGELPVREALPAKLASTIDVYADRLPAEANATTTGSGKTGNGAFADQLTFEFGNGRDHREREAACGSARVDRVAGGEEVDTPRSEVVERTNEVADAPSEAVELPDRDDISAASVDLLHQRVELRAPFLRAGDPDVHELADDLPAPLGGDGS